MMDKVAWGLGAWWGLPAASVYPGSVWRAQGPGGIRSAWNPGRQNCRRVEFADRLVSIHQHAKLSIDRQEELTADS